MAAAVSNGRPTRAALTPQTAATVGLPVRPSRASVARTPTSRCRRGSTYAWRVPSSLRANKGRLRVCRSTGVNVAPEPPVSNAAAPTAASLSSAAITSVPGSACAAWSSTAGAPPSTSATGMLAPSDKPASSTAPLPPSNSGKLRDTMTTRCADAPGSAARPQPPPWSKSVPPGSLDAAVTRTPWRQVGPYLRQHPSSALILVSLRRATPHAIADLNKVYIYSILHNGRGREGGGVPGRARSRISQLLAG